MLVIDQLSRSVLKPVSLEVSDGECVSIRGASGSGKSLLLRAIADLDPSTGIVRLDDTARDAMSAEQWRRRVIYVAAESGWWAEQVGDHFEDRDDAREYLTKLGLEDDALSWPVSRLSTGERQRLSLLRAIAQTPRVLLLDEPTSALDPEATELVEKIIQEKRENGTSIVMVTHDADQAERLADRRFVLEDGRLSEEGSQ